MNLVRGVLGLSDAVTLNFAWESGRKDKTQREWTGTRTSGGACGLIRRYAKNLT